MKSKRLKKPSKEAIALQAAELLHYQKLHLRQQLNERVVSRCDYLAEQTTPRTPAPASAHREERNSKRTPAPASAHQEPPANRHSHFSTFASDRGLPASRAQTVAEQTTPRTPAPASAHREERSSKRTPAPASAHQEPPAKRHSPVSTFVSDRGLPVTRAQPVPEATRVAWGTPATTTAYMQPLVPVPATLVQLWQRLDRQGPGLPNTAVCPCPTCPYITGAIMQRRYLLMVAFMNIERYLYGV